MTPLAVFFRTLSRTSAIAVGIAIAILQPPPPSFLPSFGMAAAGSARSQQTVQELSGLLKASDPAVRARAACDLREHADRAGAAIEALIALLPDAAPLDRSVCAQNWWRWNPENRTTPGEQAASVLVAIGSRAFDPLLAVLKHPAWFARRNAAWALGKVGTAASRDALTTATADKSGLVRMVARASLASLK